MLGSSLCIAIAYFMFTYLFSGLINSQIDILKSKHLEGKIKYLELLVAIILITLAVALDAVLIAFILYLYEVLTYVHFSLALGISLLSILSLSTKESLLMKEVDVK